MAINLNGTGSISGLSSISAPAISGVPAGSASAPAFSFNGDSNTGLYSPGADQVALSTSGTGRLFVDASGNVLVNIATARANITDTSTPRFQIEGTDFSSSYASICRNSDTAGAGPAFALLRTRGSSLSSNSAVQSDDVLGTLRFEGNYGTAFNGACAIRGIAAGTFSSGNNPGHLLFQTTPVGSNALVERLRITSAGLVGIGTSSPGSTLDVSGNARVRTGGKAGSNTYLLLESNEASNTMALSFANSTNANWQIQAVENGVSYRPLILNPAGGNVGIGVTSPQGTLSIVSGTATQLTLQTVAGAVDTLKFDSWHPSSLKPHYSWCQQGAEAMRLDSSGRFLVGTSTAGANFHFRRTGSTNADFLLDCETGVNYFVQARTASDVSGSNHQFRKYRGTLASPSAVNNADIMGVTQYYGYDGTNLIEAASIQAVVDGTPGANDMPGRLVFSTTADGASSPTERMRITNGGNTLIGKTVSNTLADVGIELFANGQIYSTTSAALPLALNRRTDDGVLIAFYQDTALEGSISVSGTTVSYNGAHLSRWSQLPSSAERTEILRGTILSSIDEMCEWGDEDNEQLNRMKVSDVEGDKNVSGVFQAWDDDDDTYTNDFYCAMTGDFIIRIGAGVTVERGDLLMSAGDGTAKPQDDDIIRSKTVAKVTSTNVSCTYDDGSYCVPCVLMAC